VFRAPGRGVNAKIAGCSGQGDIGARDAPCEAAASLMLRSRRWSALKAWGMHIVTRRSMMCAIVAVARKLAAIPHRILLDGSEFRWTAGAKIIGLRGTASARETAPAPSRRRGDVFRVTRMSQRMTGPRSAADFWKRRGERLVPRCENQRI
jgi:hypothetical protein